MRTSYHGWRSPRKGWHWSNLAFWRDVAIVWACENASRWLRRKEIRKALELELDSIRKIPLE